MSLTSFLDEPEVKAKFKPFRPKGLGTVPPTLVAPLDTKSASLVGTAFDYLLRFEIERTQKVTLHKVPWIAELSFERIRKHYALTPAGRRRKNPGSFFLGCEALFEKAKSSYVSYISNPRPSDQDKLAVSRACIDLARFDLVYRIGCLDDIGQPKRPADLEDLVQLLRCLRIDSLLIAEQFWLNPNFGIGSDLLHGADADLIAGNVLIDVKTTVNPSLSGNMLNQLLGYFLLSRFCRHLEPTFPKIDWCAIYFSRQAHVVKFPVTVWTEQSEFQQFEGWFHAAAFKHHKESNEFRARLFGQ